MSRPGLEQTGAGSERQSSAIPLANAATMFQPACHEHGSLDQLMTALHYRRLQLVLQRRHVTANMVQQQCKLSGKTRVQTTRGRGDAPHYGAAEHQSRVCSLSWRGPSPG